MRKNNFFEERIMKKIYFFETKKTVVEIILKTLILIFLVLILLIFLDVFYSILKEEKTFDLIILLKEDPEVVKRYFFDNITIFFLEIPKIILAFLFLLILSLFLFILYLRKNYLIIRNKVISLLKFWRKKI